MIMDSTTLLEILAESRILGTLLDNSIDHNSSYQIADKNYIIFLKWGAYII